MNLARRLAAEWIGSLLLAATVVGSGVMAECLAGGNVAVALLANTGATVAVLATLIALLAPVSKAHFNPAVCFVEAMRGSLSWRDTASYAVARRVSRTVARRGGLPAWGALSLIPLYGPLIQPSDEPQSSASTGCMAW